MKKFIIDNDQGTWPAVYATGMCVKDTGQIVISRGPDGVVAVYPPDFVVTVAEYEPSEPTFKEAV